MTGETDTTRQPDSLRDLARATLAFYARFGTVPQTPAAIRNLEEEVRELIGAAQEGSDPDHIAEEAADVFVTALGVCFAAGLDIDTVVRQVYAVIAKNDAKTSATHHVVDGKIRRRMRD